MKKVVALAGLALILSAGLVAAESDTEREVKQTIIDNFRHMNETSKGVPDVVPKDGAVEFWSSGGLKHYVAADDSPGEWEMVSLTPKHIEVLTLVEGQAAVAMYYSEGSMQPKGYPAVSHYMTRVTEVYVKEDGKWKRRAAHWSPIAGGSGTTQTAAD